MVKNYSLKTSKNNFLQVSVFFAENVNYDKSLIFVHGFKGFKDWGFGPYIGEYFANKGFYTITFNFSHNGIGDNPLEFTEFEKFQENTFSLEIEELNDLIDSIRNGFFENLKIDSKIGVCGHSRGGAISILTCSNRNDISAIAIWASVSKLDRYSKRQKEEWRKKGFFEVMNMRTKQVMKLGIELLNDIENNSDRLNIENAVRKLKMPLFIAHGDQDLAVPIKEAEEIYEWSDKSKTEFYKMIGTGHTFHVTHPFHNTNPKFEKLLDKTYKFFFHSLQVN
ncbi:MAG: prolyl oligopeptidase family serine peptidase [Melioribacteraceae bacterium]|nr:prolyl oligopeptidase family serine peptidase [Melioribacteraceae bacterium]